MSNISKKFKTVLDKGEKLFIPYIMAGDPDLQLTERMIYRLEESGADIIELGIPFSDPMADGPTIQLAAERALINNVTLKDVLILLEKVRKKSDIPIILMGYYNPIFFYGPEKFAKDAKKAGADGLLIVDLPPDEAGELKPYTDKEGLDIIFLAAPTSTDERLKLIAENAAGFVYYVSIAGVTGARTQLADTIKEKSKLMKSYVDIPVGVGFGISNKEQVKELSASFDAVVVGSAIVKHFENFESESKLIDDVGNFVKELKSATRLG
ncbi:tryptophan synthase subunit alpha [Thermodesulfobacteriota bacterium]